METDSFFHQLWQQLPQTLFELLGQPSERARGYRFDSVEIKKSFRIDGLYVPLEPGLPVYLVEVQFRRSATFYANLFAKVFLFLEANPYVKEWAAVAVFESRRYEPKDADAYEDLLRSKRVTRIYLDEYPMPANPPPGIGIVHLLTAPEREIKGLVARLKHQAQHEIVDGETRRKVIELAEELLMRRFTEFDREEIRKMFHLHDLRESKVWQEAHGEGIEEGIAKGIAEGIAKGIAKGEASANIKWVRKCLAKGMSVKEIAELMEISVKEVRRLAKEAAK